MKILIDASASFLYHSTGIGAYATELVRALEQIENPHNLFLFTGKDVFSTTDQNKPPSKTVCSFWQRSAKNKMVITDTFDLYHNLHNGIGMKETGNKKIVTIHDMIPCILPEYCGSPYKELFREETQKSAEAADAVITVSENSKKDILRFTNVKEENVHVIAEAPKSNCKPLPQKLTADYLLSHYHLRSPFFLYVGGFNERKNVAGLIKAYASICRDFPYVCPLVIIGKEGKRCKKLKELAQTLSITPFLRFPGYVPDHDLPFFYNQCRALIYPSFYEGFGLPPLEAAACRTAVVTSNRASLKEVMADGALYADPGNTAALALHLYSLTADDDLRETMALRAYERSKNFSYMKTAQQTLALYENICR
jgi:glycosyltransferase involved in cell wall biosynthesis